MKSDNMRAIVGVFWMVLFLCGGAQFSTYAQDAAAKDDEEQVANGSRKRRLEGVWRVTTTPINCTTGNPIPNAAFEALFTFHRGGTMSAWAQNAVITTTRSPSHGLWQREEGWREYSFKFLHLRYSPTTGAFIGNQEAVGVLELGESGYEFTSESQTRLFDASGNPTGGGCATSVGTRYSLD